MSVGNNTTERLRAPHLGPERRRPQVLDAALQLATGRGVRGVSMEAVAQQLGVTKPVVYACYASREELLTALLAREEQKLFDGVMAALPQRLDHTNPQAMVIHGFQALLKAVERHADSWQLVFAADPDPAVADRYGQARQRVAQRVSLLMGLALQAQGVKDVARKLPVLVELFMSMGDGAVRALLQGKSQWSTDELGAYVGGMVFSALQQA